MMLLLLEGVVPDTGCLAIPLNEWRYQDQATMLPYTHFRFDYSSRRIRIPVFAGSIKFQFGTSAANATFPSNGIFEVQFSLDWNNVIGVNLVSPLSDQFYYLQPTGTPPPPPSKPAIYIMDDGHVDPPTAPIQRNGDAYTLTGNITSDGDGINIQKNNVVIDGAGYTIQGNGSECGFNLSCINHVTVKNAEITNFCYGIYLNGSSSNSIYGNNITANNGYGIYLSSSSNNSVSGSNITNNGYGIYLSSSSNNSISGNNITNNYRGIRLGYSSNNRFYHNNLIYNAQQVYFFDSGYANVWDDGYSSGGNYWSDYIGDDAYSGPYQNVTGSDGIGDTPYVIDANNQDNYPLMNPWSSGWKLDFTPPTNHPIVDFAVYNGSLYAAADNRLHVKEGSVWSVIDAPTFVTSLEPYGGKLVVGGQGGLYCYDGASFDLIFSVPTYIGVLGAYNNTLYAGTMLDNPPRLYYCNGSADNPADWHIDTGFSTILNFSGAFGSIDSFAVYGNVMYVGSGGTLYSFNGTQWSTAKSYDDACAFLDMQVYNGKLYLATRDQAWRKPLYQGGTGFSGRVIEYDGENWTTVLDHDYWVYSLEVYDDKLYAGTANKILMYNGTSWVTSFNATEGAYYAISMITYDGKIYAGMGNGYIFADPAPAKQTPRP
jgi:parallel beta-helix repeat protein